MKIYSFGSGSSGNATIINFNSDYLAIDLGISLKEYKTYLNKYDIKLEDIQGFLITHEHIDHIRSISLAPINKIFTSPLTLCVKGINELELYQEYDIGNFKVKPIPSSHDCKQGLNFVISYKKTKIVYITDTGSIKSNLYKYIKNADYYIIESNYDYEMLLNCNRPFMIKKRISSPSLGHLSNFQCAITLSKVIGKKTKGIVLCHISEDTNTYDLAIETTKQYLIDKGIDISNMFITCFKQREDEVITDEEK